MAYQPIQNPLPVTGSLTAETNPAQLDAFGRLRVSQMRTQLDLKHTQDENPLYVDQEVNGSGNISRIAADSMMQMTTSGAGDFAISQTKQRFAYFSGKSFLMFLTFSSFQVQANITKRVGYFSTNTTTPFDSSRDGIYLESDGSNISVNIGKSGAIDKIIQSGWNKDKMDGTGPSGVNLDFSKAQIMICDFEWLGVGSVRVGFVVAGSIIYFHEFEHANNVTAVYMKHSNQPIRYEVRQTGAGSGTFNYICATVASEGEVDEVGKVISLNNGSTHLDANSTGVKYMLLGLRLKTVDSDTLVQLLTASLLAETQDNFLWEIVINPNVAGSVSWSPIDNSALEKTAGVTSNVVTGGTTIASGYVAVSRQAGGAGSGVIENAIRIGTEIDGTKDEVFLVVTPLSSNLDILGSLTWREFN